MTNELHRIYETWMEMWNGKPELADEIVAEHCAIHQAGSFIQEGSGPEHVRTMVRMGRAPFKDVAFRAEVGPISEGNKLAARWTMKGVYHGGIPGATAPENTEIVFGGMDIMTVKDGRITEYWVSSDGLHLLEQLGIAVTP